jgi:hypothetical protein
MNDSSPSALDTVTADQYRSRLAALLGSGGLTTGFPRKRRDLMIILHAVASRFSPGEELSETDATGRIGGFLMLAAPGWKMDRATLRRALIDEGFLDRDADGTRYRLSDRHLRQVQFDPVPALEALIAQWR